MSNSKVDYSAYRFLIADDKAFLRHLVQNVLMRCNALEIKHASDGTEAMEVLSQSGGAIDCVLCDWNMAPMDGLALLRAIRSGNIPHTRRDLRVIMLTGDASETVVKTAISMSANGYVVKPASFDTLTAAITEAFRKPLRLKSSAVYSAMRTVEMPDTIYP